MRLSLHFKDNLASMSDLVHFIEAFLFYLLTLFNYALTPFNYSLKKRTI